MARAEIEARLEAWLAQHPDIARLLVYVDPVKLAQAAVAVQLGQGAEPEEAERLRRVEKGLRVLAGL